MKTIAFVFALSTLVAPAVKADDASQIDQDTAVQEESQTVSADAYIVHAMRLADLSANRAAISSFSAPVSASIRNQAYSILGNTGRIENLLYYMSGAYDVDFAQDGLPSDLAEIKLEIDKAVEALQAADATTADQAYADLMALVDDLEAHAIAYAEENDVSESLKSFLQSNFG